PISGHTDKPAQNGESSANWIRIGIGGVSTATRIGSSITGICAKGSSNAQRFPDTRNVPSGQAVGIQGSVVKDMVPAFSPSPMMNEVVGTTGPLKSCVLSARHTRSFL